MTGSPVMLDLKGLNKCCFGWVKFGHSMPFLTISDHKMALTFDIDFQLFFKCHKFTYGIWFDRNRHQDQQIWTSWPRYISFYRFEPSDWWPSWKYANKKIATG